MKKVLLLGVLVPLCGFAQGTPPGAYGSGGTGGGGTNFGTTTVVVTGGANGLAGTSGFGTTSNVHYVITANDTESAAITFSASGDLVECADPGIVVQFTGATSGFNVSGNQNLFKGCTYDHNSQTGAGTGPLFNITGNDDVVDQNYFQNTGLTNPASATVNVGAGASRPVITRNNFLATQADSAIGLDAAGNCVGAIHAPRIEGNLISNFNGGATNTEEAINANDNNGSCVIDYAEINDNTIYLAGNNSYGIFLTAQGAGNHINWHVSSNTIIETARVAIAIKLFFNNAGLGGSVICYNTVYGSGQVSIGDISFGDLYDSVVCGNVVFTGGVSDAFTCADCSRDIIDGNSVFGVTSQHGMVISSISFASSNNTVSHNHVQMTAGGTCYNLSSANGASDHNVFLDDYCQAAGTAGSIGLSTTGTLGTITNTAIQDFHVYNTVTGVSLGTTASTTKILDPQFETITTPYSLSSAAFIQDLMTGMTFANRPTDADVANGSMIFLSDATFANPCAAGGTGAIDKRLNGVNRCD